MSTFFMMVGLPASGKSTNAKKLALELDAIVISSDAIREEIFGNEEEQGNPALIFELVFKRARVLLGQGKNVIIDATNINSKKRIGALKQFNGFRKICYYMATSKSTCEEQDRMRTRRVGNEVINRMERNLQIPTYSEGWDEINIISNPNDHIDDLSYPIAMRKFLESNSDGDMISYEELFDLFDSLIPSNHINKIKDLPHDSKYHNLSVGRHSYHVFEYLHKNYHESNRLEMLWASLLHDIGKYHTKEFKRGSRYANFIGHENVSAQIAINTLSLMDYSQQFILNVATLIQNHMKHYDLDTDDRKNQYRQLVGDDIYNSLERFNEADRQAH